MVMGIGRIVNLWRTKVTPLIKPPTAVTGGSVETDSTAEQTRFSATKRVQAGLYGRDGKLEDVPKLDEPP